MKNVENVSFNLFVLIEAQSFENIQTSFQLSATHIVLNNCLNKVLYSHD